MYFRISGIFALCQSLSFPPPLFNGIFKNGASYNSWLQLKPVFKLPFLLFYTNIMNICELYEVYK